MGITGASHGGSDPGASGNGIIEKELALKISQYLYNRFKELGADVKIIRDSDETISPDERVKRILDAYGDKSDVVVLSNHLNAGGGTGAEVIYALRNKDTLAKSILEEIEKSGQETRRYFQKRLPSNTDKDYYFIHRNTGKTEPVLIEYGFLDNLEDAARLKQNYEKYAEAVVRAVSEYLNIKYTPPVGETVYIVKKGDSLWTIANKLGVSVDELKSFNNLTNNNLSIDQILLVPTETTSQEKTYTVKSGDNLWYIANKYNITVDELKNANGLTSNLLNIGQILKIPESPPTNVNPEYIEYIVEKGDSLWSIANKYNTTVNSIKTLNELKGDSLQIGQKLLIPIQNENNTPTTSEDPPINVIKYTVKSGDSLYAIAQKFRTTVNEIKNVNNLSSDLLSIGQILKIPSTNDFISYTVKSGDSLYSIAQKYNTTVNNIKEYNNLSSNILQIGQDLKIPTNI